MGPTQKLTSSEHPDDGEIGGIEEEGRDSPVTYHTRLHPASSREDREPLQGDSSQEWRHTCPRPTRGSTLCVVTLHTLNEGFRHRTMAFVGHDFPQVQWCCSCGCPWCCAVGGDDGAKDGPSPNGTILKCPLPMVTTMAQLSLLHLHCQHSRVLLLRSAHAPHRCCPCFCHATRQTPGRVGSWQEKEMSDSMKTREQAKSIHRGGGGDLPWGM